MRAWYFSLTTEIPSAFETTASCSNFLFVCVTYNMQNEVEYKKPDKTKNDLFETTYYIFCSVAYNDLWKKAMLYITIFLCIFHENLLVLVT